jgi:hypothetical protein
MNGASWIRNPLLSAFLAGSLLSSCASAPAADQAPVQIFNVHKTGGEALPEEVEGCEPLGSVRASTSEPEASNVVSLAGPQALLETIRSRARRKGADTAFVSFDPKGVQVGQSSLRATVFRCGDSTVPQTLGSPVR